MLVALRMEGFTRERLASIPSESPYRCPWLSGAPQRPGALLPARSSCISSAFTHGGTCSGALAACDGGRPCSPGGSSLRYTAGLGRGMGGGQSLAGLA